MKAIHVWEAIPQLKEMGALSENEEAFLKSCKKLTEMGYQYHYASPAQVGSWFIPQFIEWIPPVQSPAIPFMFVETCAMCDRFDYEQSGIDVISDDKIYYRVWYTAGR